MRELVNFYLMTEWLSKEPSSPIEADNNSEQRRTKLTTYHNNSNFEKPNKYHKDYSGATHEVSWINNKDKNTMNKDEQKKSLHDAFHLHHHFVKHGTETGDIIKNKPLDDDDQKGGNKRAKIYRKGAGFGEVGKDGHQYGIVKQHPHDHEDESKRGQKYLHPLEHHEIESHGDKPSAGASDNKVRHISRNVPGVYSDHITKLNGVVHSLTDTMGDRTVSHHTHGDKTSASHMRDLANAHKASINRNLGVKK
jgi:hypothetical protein